MAPKNLWKLWHEYHYSAFAPLIALVLLLGLLLGTTAIDRVENPTIDWRFQLRAPHDPPSDPRLLLVGIDETSIKAFGAWPWDRARHADLCKLLSLANPSVVAFDILFTEKSVESIDQTAANEKKLPDSPGPKVPANPDDLFNATDTDLGVGMSKPRVVISGAMFSDLKAPATQPDLGKTAPLTGVEGDISQLMGAESALYPITPVRDASLFGFVNVEPASSDGIRRKVPMVVRIGREIFPTLSLQILCQFWNLTPSQIHVHLGRDITLDSPEGVKIIPIDQRGLLLLNYRDENSFTALPYAGLTRALYLHFAKGEPMPEKPLKYPSLEGKILIIGQTQEGLSDMGPSPLQPVSPLVLVHLNAVNNILTNDYLRETPLPLAIPPWLAVTWATLFYLRKKSPTYSVVVPVTLAAAYVALAISVFDRENLVLPLAWPIASFTALNFGAIVLRWLEELRAKQQIRGVFATYIAPAVLNQLLEHPENIRLGGVRKPVTILFSDIRGFTTLTESMGDEELVQQLNEYFEKMVDCLNKYRGTHHKYIGDAVMAVWGDVVAEKPEVDAANAVRAALAMRAELDGLNAVWAAAKRPAFKIGIGLNHGTVVVGNIGATQKREFTVIGDPVNLASRIEGLTKTYHTDLAIGETVHALVRDEFLTRTVGLIQVKGKTHPVRIYEVLDDPKKPTGQWPAEWVARYEKGVEAYLSRRFTEAQSLFEECLKERKDDYCSQHYLDLSRELIVHPPPKDWDGTEVMKTK